MCLTITLKIEVNRRHNHDCQFDSCLTDYDHSGSIRARVTPLDLHGLIDNLKRILECKQNEASGEEATNNVEERNDNKNRSEGSG